MAPTPDRPAPASRTSSGARLVVILRRLVGLVGLVIAAGAVMLFPVLFYTARVFGAAGDHFQRVLIGYGIGIAVACLVAVVGLTDSPLRSIIRSPTMRIVFVVLILSAAWAVFGIDSTRSVRSLPEASLRYPGAVETSRWAAPAEGGMDAVARARVTFTMTSEATDSEIEAFYASELTRRGWMYVATYGSTDGGRAINWDRNGFGVQLRFPTSGNPGTGTFSVAIFGPVQ